MNKNFKVTYLQCASCAATYPANTRQTVCKDASCAGSLYVIYDFKQGFTPAIGFNNKPNTMWRYVEFLPVKNVENIVSLGEGFTPIIEISDQEITKGNKVFWKDESGNPTGSFKSRGMSVAVSMAKELGIKSLVTPTAGNAGGALAAYCAKAGIQAHVLMPKLTPKIFKDECRLYGAELIEVAGNIADCGKLAKELALVNNWFSVATLQEPYRLEGKKTMGYEIAEQFNWQLPDVILYPTGGGTGLLGIWKAFDEMETLGWIGSKRPKMVAVQSDKCAGIVDAFHEHRERSEYKDEGFTIANGLRVPKPYADRQILAVLTNSRGNAIAVSDEAMKEAMFDIAANQGLLVAPEGSALWVAFKELKSSGWLDENSKVLLLNTGSGYKYLENVL